MAESLSRDEYIAKYGYDPELDNPVDPNDRQYKPGVVGNITSTLTSEIGSLPTLAVSAPFDIYAGMKAAYNAYTQDKNFMQEWQKERMVDDAQKNIDEHLKEVAATWASEEPDLSEEDLSKSLENYMKSKEFEDFTTSQLSLPQRINAKWKDTIRGIQGDERTEEERPMWENILGIASTAAVGAPATIPLKISNAAAKAGGVVNALVNNPVSRVGIKTAELLTPVTIPYTPINAAANFGVGVALDQAQRYFTNKPTMLGTEDDSGVKAMAATGLGVGGVLAVVAAVRGRTGSLLQAAKSDTARAIANKATLDAQLSDPMRVGEAAIVAGREQQTHPPSYNDTLPWYKRIPRTVLTQSVDENAMEIGAIRDIQGPEAANRIEGLMSVLMGSIGRDRRVAQVAEMIQPVNDVLATMSPEDARALKWGAQMSSYKADLQEIRDFNVQQINDLANEIRSGKFTAQVKGKKKAELKQLKDDLARFDADAESARPRLPERPMSEARQIGTEFENDTSPQAIAFKDALKKVNREVLDQQVAAHKLTQQEADKLHARNPYYVSLINDPLKGDTGTKRLFRSVQQSAERKLVEGSKGTAGVLARESPIEQLDRKIGNFDPSQPETRVTAQMDLQSSLRQYVEQSIIDTTHTRARNERLRNLAFKDGIDLPGNDTDFYKNGHMRVVKVFGREWNKGALEKDPHVVSLLEGNQRIVREWQNGSFRLWELGDIAIARGMRAEPVLFNGIVRLGAKSNNMFKFFTTGYGNPLFAVPNAYYDSTVGIIAHPNNRVYGVKELLTRRYLPERAAKFVNAAIPDPSPILMWPIYSTKALIDTLATRTAHFLARQLELETPVFSALKQVIGTPAYETMVRNASKVAMMTHELATNHAFRQGFSRSAATIDDISKVRGHYEMATDKMPPILRQIVQLWKDVVNSVYIGPKLQYYLENKAILIHEHGGFDKVPKHMLEKLDYDVHVLGGDMSKVPANYSLRQTEAITPYMPQAKLGAYYLLRNLGNAETRASTWPRLFHMMMMYSAGMYMMNYWNDESREEVDMRTSEYDRYRYLYVPTIQLLMAWFRGENPAYSRDLYYKIPLAPDIVGITAGAAALMEQLHVLPSSGTPKAIAPNYPNIVMSNMLPAMPPALQLALGASGMRLDPQTADRRGGNWIRSFQDAFKGGPEAEAATSLGEVSNTTSLMLNAAFGVFGSHLAIASDVLLHSLKYGPTASGGKVLTQAEQTDFAKGLKNALGEIVFRSENKLKDVPLLWQGRERYQTMTPAWQYVGESNFHIKSIKGMVTSATGPTAELGRQMAAASGGMPKQVLIDPTLITMGSEIVKFQNPTGELGQARAQYKKLGDMNTQIMANYNVSQAERQQKSNTIIKMMQDNMDQQHLMIKYKEQELAAKYGQYIRPILNGRDITMSSIDQMLRQRLGVPARQSAEGAAAQESED